MNGWAPCGECRAYVSTDVGCKHWKPGSSAKAEEERARRLRHNAAVERARKATP